MVLNIVVLIALGLVQVLNIYVMLSGRILLGYAAGAMTVIGSRFISEITPISLSGPSVALISFQVTGSIFVVFLVSHLLVPYNEDPDFATSQTW